MKRILMCAFALLVGLSSARSQSLEDLNIQIHGYATQGFLYTTQNNAFTTQSSNGSPSWTEAVVNVTAQPQPKLRVGVQARYFVLGNFGNEITLDWALADYRANDKLGVRFGKVKTPLGLFNEVQDIDPSYMWSLLPQGVYPITSRNSLLAHFGGVVYGTLKVGDKGGKLEYRGWGGQRTLTSDDGYTLSQREQGMNLPNGLTSTTSGATLRWQAPVKGLMIGASDSISNKSVSQLTAANGMLAGTQTLNSFQAPYYFARLERDKFMVAGEYNRLPIKGLIAFPHLPVSSFKLDQRSWYAMASYKVTGKLSAGLYQSQSFNRTSPLGPGRYSKDWAISGRYDFSEFLYAKAEQHFIDGTRLDYDYTANGVTPGAASPTKYPDTALTILKIGVSF